MNYVGSQLVETNIKQAEMKAFERADKKRNQIIDKLYMDNL